MALVTLDEVKTYLRVDSTDDDGLIQSLLDSAGILCAGIARLTDEEWEAVDAESDDLENGVVPSDKLSTRRKLIRVAVMYAVGYLYEHREEADHHGLTLTLRSLLFSIREGVV